MLNADTFSVREIAKVQHILNPGAGFEDNLACALMAAKELGITDDPDAEIGEADANRITAWFAEI